MPLTKAQIDELESVHKRVTVLNGRGDPPEFQVVLRAPTRPEYKMFRAMSHNPSQLADAQEILFRKICVYPVDDALNALLESFPGLPEGCGKAIADLSGMSAQADLK